MNAGSKFLLKSLKPYLKKGYTFCADTNFFMEAPEVIEGLKGERILISEVVFSELDKNKADHGESTPEARELAYKVRLGQTAMDLSGAIRILKPDFSFLKSKGLHRTNDELIIGTYLHHYETTGEKVIFLTLDKGARTIARSVGLPVSDHDIAEFNRLKGASNGSGSKKAGGQIPKDYAGSFMSKLRYVFFGFLAFVVLFVIIGVVAGHEEEQEFEKTFTLVQVENEALAFELLDVKITGNDTRKGFIISYEVTNKSQDELVLTNAKELARLKKENIRPHIRGVSPFRIMFTDGTEDLIGRQTNILPNQKETLTITGQGEIKDIKSIEANYFNPTTDTYGTITIQK